MVMFAHGMSNIGLKYTQVVLHEVTTLEVFIDITRKPLHADVSYDYIMHVAVSRNDLAWAQEIHRISPKTLPCVDSLTSPSLEMVEWVSPIAPEECVDATVLTSQMIEILHAHKHTVPVKCVGMGYTDVELCACITMLKLQGNLHDIKSVMEGIIAARRWDLCRRYRVLIPSDSHYEIVSTGPDDLLQHVTHFDSIHEAAWEHSQERAEWALKQYPPGDESVTALTKEHVIFLRERSINVDFSELKLEPWMLQFGYFDSHMWNVFPIEYYPQLHGRVDFPKTLTVRDRARLQYMHASGLIIPANMLKNQELSYEFVEFVLANSRQDLRFNITYQSVPLVELLIKHGWTVQPNNLHGVHRVDTFLWMLARFGSDAEIWRKVDAMHHNIRDALFEAQPDIPADIFQHAKTDSARAWLQTKGFVPPSI